MKNQYAVYHRLHGGKIDIFKNVRVEIEGGALQIFDEHGLLLQAYAPGAWLDCSRDTTKDDE